MRSNATHARGFTLIEAAIAVAIMALAAGVVLPALGNMSRADLRKSASILAGHIRSTFNQAALSGQTYRLVFQVGSGEGEVKVQASQGALALDGESNALVDGAKASREYASLINGPLDFGSADADEDSDDAAPDDAMPGAGAGIISALLGVNRLGGGAEGFQDVGRFELDDGVKLLDVWLEGSTQPTIEGEVYLVFFPHGYTQAAVIHLEDGQGRVYAVRVQPLTGRTEVLDHYVEASR